MQVAIVSYIHSVENWSKAHPMTDIKRIEPVAYTTCGHSLTYFAIYYEEGENETRDSSDGVSWQPLS